MGGAEKRRAALLAILASAVYLNTLGYGFTYDDFWLVVNNTQIRSLKNDWALFTEPHLENRIYRPLTLLSFSLDYAVAGLRPWLYHAENVLLHAGITVLVYLLLRRLSPEAAWPAAALFAVLPVHTEVVANVASRSELLAALFGLGALLQLRRPAVAALLLFLGLLAKETAAAIPALALLLWWRSPEAPSRRQGARILAALAAVFTAYLGARYWVHGRIGFPESALFELDNPLAEAELFTGRRTALMILAQNLALCVIPYHLSADYSFAQIPLVTAWTDLQFVLWTLLLLSVLAGALMLRRISPEPARGLLWFLVAVAPVSNLLLPIGTIRAERVLYLPSVGVCLALAEIWRLAVAAPSRRASKLVAAGTLAVLLMALGAVTVRRNRVWQSQETLLAATRMDAPRSARAHYLWADHKMVAGDFPAAAPAFRRAIEIYPDFSLARTSLGYCLEKMGDLEGAAAEYRRVFNAGPESTSLAHGLVRVCTARGDWACVAVTLRRLIAANPQAAAGADAWLSLGNALFLSGDRDEAEAAFRRAATLGRAPLAAFNLAGLLARRGRFAEAAQQYAAAERLGMKDQQLYLDWNTVLRKAREPTEARRVAARGLGLHPDSVELRRLAGK